MTAEHAPAEGADVVPWLRAGVCPPRRSALLQDGDGTGWATWRAGRVDGELRLAAPEALVNAG